MEQLWRQFKAPPMNELDEVNYYLQIFEPYADLQLDFRLLAVAIARVWNVRIGQVLDIDLARYNFNSLKKYMELLRQSTDMKS